MRGEVELVRGAVLGGVGGCGLQKRAQSKHLMFDATQRQASLEQVG